MAAQTNLTVRNAANSADVVYTALTPSSGDKTPAEWRNIAVGNNVLVQGGFSISSNWNGNRSARHVHVKMAYPDFYNDSGTGMDVVNAVNSVSATFILPAKSQTSIWKELGAQFANLLDHAEVQKVFETGYAPT